MPKALVMTDAQISAILADLKAGASVRATAKAHGVSAMTISRIGAANGIDANRTRTKKANEARRDYAQTARLGLLNKVFDRIEEILPTCTRAQELAQLTTALAIAIDKRRLEDGEATSRSEVSSHGVRERLVSKLDELAARRRPAGAA